MRKQPHSVSYKEAQKVCEAYGWPLMRNGKGSHRIFTNSITGEHIALKDANPLKISYIIKILERVVGE